jgi:regulator of protease activity HflC (stomatin/prohibitin superfamily)
MAAMSPRKASRERKYKAANGGIMLFTLIVFAFFLVAALFYAEEPSAPVIVLVILGLPAIGLGIRGFFIVQPNSSKVLVLLGNYKGTARDAGFYWANPFAQRRGISLKANNIASNVIKVNDLSGNPIEIGAVVVWQVRDTAQASFDVEDFRHYVDVQIETAVRKLASVHPYDEHGATDKLSSLRGDSEVVNEELRDQLEGRLERAGIEVLEARISHLAYAPEIAAAMLQRQQAAAIISARKRIVEGAVGMVEDALSQLQAKGVVDLDPEKRATLVGNLLVVLCGQENAQPIINTGTLYS